MQEHNKLLALYVEGKPIRVIANHVTWTIYEIRKWLLGEGLAIKVKDRSYSYAEYITRKGMTDDVDPIIYDWHEDKDASLYKKLDTAERALIRARDELNYHRATKRKDERKESLVDQVTEIIEASLGSQVKHTININQYPLGENFNLHTSMMLLSDIHAEELVTSKNVGNLNEYNWEVMEERVGKLFDEWLLVYRGEHQGVIFLLGDMISGVIHSTLEHTTKPTAEAVHDLAEFLSKRIAIAAAVFPKIHIGFVSGNHERIQEKPSTTNKGFDFGYLFAQILKAKLSPYTNVDIEISTTGFTTYVIGDKVCLAHHGDIFRGPFSTVRTTKIQASCEAVTGLKPDHIFEGHVHNFSHHNNSTGVSLINASVIGPNEYGLTAGFAPNRPSQTIVQFKPNGVVDAVKQVFLDEV